MGKPFWLDSSTIGQIADGDVALEEEINAKRARGAQLLMVPKVKEEVLHGNPLKSQSVPPSAEHAKARQAVIDRLQIQIDMMGDKAERRALFEKQFKFYQKPRGNPPRGVTTRSIQESDAIVLSEIAASAKARNVNQPEFFTSDTKLANAPDAKLWGVNIVTRTSAKPPP